VCHLHRRQMGQCAQSRHASRDTYDALPMIDDTKANEWPIALIEDPDRASIVANGGGLATTEWQSILQMGVLIRDDKGEYSVKWRGELPFRSKYSYGGRGMELSDLAMFNNELVSIDDRTGILFKVSSQLLLYVLSILITSKERICMKPSNRLIPKQVVLYHVP
jgi:hypothetical protein